ncbi:MAG: hypothetical protein FD548_000156 [Pelagibacterales bacterium]|nr:hypothetical protein [Pelagibacterales bacterium]
MKILKLLNKKNLIILIIYKFLFISNLYSEEVVDIWNLDKSDNKESSQIIIEENDDNIEKSVFINNSKKINTTPVDEGDFLNLEEETVFGLYDPQKNNLSIDMWTYSDGKKISKIMNNIKKMNLSKDSKNILNIAILTNSYPPQKNITKEDFLSFQSSWLIKNNDLELIKKYLINNHTLKNNILLARYFVDQKLSRTKLDEACRIFEEIKKSINDSYLSKFYIYCLINDNKKEEAQLQFDLIKENGFTDTFFEKIFFYLIGYEDEINSEISEDSLLDFHLSHRTNLEFKFIPKNSTSNLVWKYLSSSNLLENVNNIDLEDQDKIFTIEKATSQKNYTEKELFDLYKRFTFNIDQLLNVKQSYKLLTKSEARALVYQGILITTETKKKIELIKILKTMFEKDEISNAFNDKLIFFLKNIDIEDVPSNHTNFYNFYIKNEIKLSTKIKFNNKIIHQSKLLNYFKNDLDVKFIEKELSNLLKKIKKNKNYFFTHKDNILIESLKSDGVQIPKKYNNFYKSVDANIPIDIQVLINNNETGLTLLRLVEIIGEDKIQDIDDETLYFIVSVLNQLDMDTLRNKILLKILPLKS